MPIEVSMLEPQIYQGEWIGHVTIDEVFASMEEASQAADENGNDRYVLLVNLAAVTQIPFDLRNLLKISNSDDGVIEFIVVNAPPVGQALGNMLRKLSNQPFSFASSIEDGITAAHDCLAAKGLVR